MEISDARDTRLAISCGPFKRNVILLQAQFKKLRQNGAIPQANCATLYTLRLAPVGTRILKGIPGGGATQLTALPPRN